MAVTVMAPELDVATPRVEEPLYEVIKGQRVELPPMGAFRARVGSILDQRMGMFADQNNRGRVVSELLFLLDRDADQQRRPDVAFVSYQRWPRQEPVPDDAAWDVIPDLAVEIVSPTNRAEEQLEKVLEYFEAGVSAVWVIYPKLRVIHLFDSFTQVRVLTRGATLDGGPLLPGFQLPLATLFEDDAEGPAGTA